MDPATKDYDEHLERMDDGIICGKTKIGEYMVNEVFEFNIRPMREIWQIMQLVEKKKRLREKIKLLTADQKQNYIEIDGLLEKLQEILFEKKE